MPEITTLRGPNDRWAYRIWSADSGLVEVSAHIYPSPEEAEAAAMKLPPQTPPIIRTPVPVKGGGGC